MPVLPCPDDASSLMPVAPEIDCRTAARAVLAAAAAGAGVIHLDLAPAHLADYLPLGVGFVAAGVIQIAWGAYLLVRESPRALALGGTFTMGLLAVYLMSRTVGLPLGPEAFQAQPLGRADLVCCALELPVATGCFLLAGRPRAMTSLLRVRATAVTASTLLLIVAATTLAVTSPAHEQGIGQQHEHDGNAH